MQPPKRGRYLAIGMLMVGAVLVAGQESGAYPLDGYAYTGIRRLARLERIAEGRLAGPPLLKGQTRRMADIGLNLTDERGMALTEMPPPDPALQKQVDALFPNLHESYSIAILDITPGRPIRYAGHQEDRNFSPGSVGKLAVVAGLFTELKTLFPDDPEKRRALLRSRMVTADRFIITDSHTVPIFDPETGAFTARPPRIGDRFSLYEWTDHMLSASANAAASMVWKELLLMRRFGAAYPPSPEAEEAFLAQTPKSELMEMAMSVVNDPLRRIGITADQWHLGSLFTAGGKKAVPGSGNSRATPKGLLKYLIAMEQGRIVDPWSSLEIKRLTYMTARRIRYASSPALNDAAVCFKSGSLYKCRAEAGFTCGKYKGNVENYMNSVAVVAHPSGTVYLVGFMSNVLRKNSAVDHQSLATRIDRIMRQGEKQP